jgi:hypothetical protein
MVNSIILLKEVLGWLPSLQEVHKLYYFPSAFS